MKAITYKDSGVDIARADRLIDTLKDRIKASHNVNVLNMIGGFAALTEVPKSYRNPVLGSSTDGVGTKLKIAFMAGMHDTVGVNLVGMSVNDILTLGAKPLFFLDYYACGKIDENVYPAVVGGVCDGCLQADCALVGGETAEMPSFYKDDEYDKESSISCLLAFSSGTKRGSIAGCLRRARSNKSFRQCNSTSFR